MSYQELSSQINKDLYPDVVEAGGVPMALAKALADLPGALQVSTLENSTTYARVADGARSSQLSIALHERLFLFYFGSEGVGYGNGKSSILTEAAQAIHFWITQKPSIAVMERRFEVFKSSEAGKAHETGQIVGYQWDSLLYTWRQRERDSPYRWSPLPVIQAARKRPDLRQLFPFTSLNNLCFSRTTGFPYTDDCPHTMSTGDGCYRAYSAKYKLEKRTYNGSDWMGKVYEVIGEGSAEEVIEMLVMNLPPNCGPAVNGTADDLIRDQENPED
jgi:hypothetical protein